jgi:hypothetical protein
MIDTGRHFLEVQTILTMIDAIAYNKVIFSISPDGRREGGKREGRRGKKREGGREEKGGKRRERREGREEKGEKRRERREGRYIHRIRHRG